MYSSYDSKLVYLQRQHQGYCLTSANVLEGHPMLSWPLTRQWQVCKRRGPVIKLWLALWYEAASADSQAKTVSFSSSSQTVLSFHSFKEVFFSYCSFRHAGVLCPPAWSFPSLSEDHISTDAVPSTWALAMLSNSPRRGFYFNYS